MIAGEESSHSLYFELTQGWTGLLVEPLPTALNFKKRRAWVSSSCLATQPRPHYVHFNTNTTAVLDSENNIKAMGGIVLVSRTAVSLWHKVGFHAEKGSIIERLYCHDDLFSPPASLAT